MKRKIGLIINPIAGMGGKVGLKGTDGMVQKALELGAVPQAFNRAKKALLELNSMKDELVIITASGQMGEDLSKELSFDTLCVYKSDNESTTSEDTIKAAKNIMAKGVDILIFVGGDGTARDIFKAVGLGCIVIGVPAGVKIHSPVYAQNPTKAGELTYKYVMGIIKQTKEVEVLDIDEEAYRKEIVNTRLYGYLTIPLKKELTQNRKSPSPFTEKAYQNFIALDVIDNMEENILYIIGPGTTTRAIMDKLQVSSSLLGIDIISNKKLILKDASENDILGLIKNRNAKIIITPTGGQGYVLGRGNHQLSPSVIRLIGVENIMIISTKEKINSLRGRPLLVDTGDDSCDKYLSGYKKIITGYRESIIYPVKF